MAQDFEDIKYMTRKLIYGFQKWGLKVNMNKTKCMAVGDLHQDLILEEDVRKISYTEEYNYLGVKITANEKQPYTRERVFFSSVEQINDVYSQSTLYQYRHASILCRYNKFNYLEPLVLCEYNLYITYRTHHRTYFLYPVQSRKNRYFKE